MIARLFTVFFLAMLAIACGGNSKKGKDILPEAKMERVLWDMVQADEFVQAYVLKDSNKIDVKAERYKQYEKVFRLHNVTQQQFARSYDYYLSNPAKNKVLFDSLSTKANRRMQDVYKGSKPQ